MVSTCGVPRPVGNPANPEVLGAGHEQTDVRKPLWKFARNAQHHLAARNLVLMRHPVHTLEIRMTVAESVLQLRYLGRLCLDTAQVFWPGPK
jgi:hypothetical protein